MSSRQEKITVEMLLSAYCQGFFPMPDESSDRMLWFNPDPRAILPLENLYVSKSLKKVIRNREFIVEYDSNFLGVVDGCSEREETWINDEIKSLYTALYDLGFAHSIEVYDKQKDLVGGIYGVSINGAFFAESKFHRKANASKVALYYLVERLKKSRFKLLEVQFLTPHLERLGAIEVPRDDYLQYLNEAIKSKATF